MYIYEIKFPGDEEFTDISNLIRYESVNASYRLFNDGMKSVVDTFSFRIKYEQTTYQKFDLASDKIICKIVEGSTPVFTGYIGPEVSNQLGEVPEDLALTAQDNSWLLDDAVKASFEYPLTIGATPFYILSFSAPGSSIVHHLLEAAGYAVPDVFAPDCPEIISQVQHISGAADQGTYRQILDDLLMEYGHVFRFTESGHFTVVKWDKDSIAAEDTLEGNFCVNQKLSVKKGYWPYDGIKLYWNELDTMEGALLYRENLPLSVQEGTIGFTGKDIAPGDYYPKDGDIKEVFQEFRTDWLDLAYLQRDSRVENQDLSLVSSKEHSVQFDADAGVIKSSELFEQKRAKLLLQNTSGEIKKLYRLEIYGTALFRSSIQKVTVPSTAVKPAEIEAKYIFEPNQAQRFATAMKRMRQFGIRIFSFTVPRDHKEFSLGQVLHIGQADPIIDTNVLVQDKQFNDVTNLVKYVCVGITGYSPETISSTSTTPGIVPAQSEKAAEANVVSLIDNGYSSASSTGNPSQLIPQSKSGVRSIAILWPAQVTLRWIDHYEIQVSEDYDPQNPGDANWYAPSSNGIDWKGALNESVSIYDTMFIHENIPAAGTEADPQNRTLYYRVRQVTRAGVTGTWSIPVSGTTNLIGAVDILAGAIKADKINAIDLQTLLLRAAQLWVGFTGTDYISPEEGDRRIYQDGDTIEFQEWTNGAWTIVNSIILGGSDSGGNFLPFIGCRGVYNPLGDPPDGVVKPSAVTHIWDMENSYASDLGYVLEDTSGLNHGLFTTEKAKFGTRSFRPQNGKPNASLVANSFPRTTDSFTMGSYFYPKNNTGSYGTTYDMGILCLLGVDDAIQIGLKWNSNYSVLNARCLVMMDGTTVYNVTVDVTEFSESWIYLSFAYNKKLNKFSFIINDTVREHSETTYEMNNGEHLYLSLSLNSDNGDSSLPYADYFYLVSDYIEPDLLLELYKKDIPWDDTYSAADTILLPASGGVVRSMGDHVVEGLLTAKGGVVDENGDPIGGTVESSDITDVTSALMQVDDTQSYRGMTAKGGSTSGYVRTPTAGLIPYTSGGGSTAGYLGTSSWPFYRIYGSAVYGAVGNDYADAIEIDNSVEEEYGYCYRRGKDGKTGKTERYSPSGIIGITTDTQSFTAHTYDKRKDKKRIPISVAGFVLVHLDKTYSPGTPLTATKGGKLTKAKWYTRVFHPERVIATYYKDMKAEEWNGVKVNSRHLVRVK